MASVPALSSSFSDANNILMNIREVMDAAEVEQVVTFNVNHSTANYVIDCLKSEKENSKTSSDVFLTELRLLVMPSLIHESVPGWLSEEICRWLMAGTLPAQFMDDVLLLPCPEVASFIGLHSDSRKTPDMTFWPHGAIWPTVVLEVGYSESWAQLLRDKHLWSVGSVYEVNTIILVKISPPNMAESVNAKIQVNTFSSQGLESEISEDVLPITQTSRANIPLTHQKLFGGAMPAGLPGTATVDLSLDRLRFILTEMIVKAGLSV